MFFLLVITYNITFSNILILLLLKETGVPGENHQPIWSHEDEFEDTKGVIGIRKSKERQHMVNRKRTNNDLQNIHIKLKIE
jgi:hypothetical protein